MRKLSREAGTHAWLMLPMLMGVALVGPSGCTALDHWHLEDYFDQRSYVHENPESLRADLTKTCAFVESLGLTRVDNLVGENPITSAIFIRQESDVYHLSVTVSALARVDKPGWVLNVRVDSYALGREGAIQAGESMLNKIDKWHQDQ